MAIETTFSNEISIFQYFNLNLDPKLSLAFIKSGYKLYGSSDVGDSLASMSNSSCSSK